MNFPSEEIFSLYEKLLNLHIWTKTSDTVFHKCSAEFYEWAFDVFHNIMEAMQDSGIAEPVVGMQARKESYDILMKLKWILEESINGNNDIAIDNILRGLYEKIGFQCGTAKSMLDWKGPHKERTAYEKKDTDVIPDDYDDEEEENDNDKEEWMKEDKIAAVVVVDGEGPADEKSEDKTKPEEDKEEDEEDDMSLFWK